MESCRLTTIDDRFLAVARVDRYVAAVHGCLAAPGRLSDVRPRHFTPDMTVVIVAADEGIAVEIMSSVLDTCERFERGENALLEVDGVRMVPRRTSLTGAHNSREVVFFADRDRS